MIIRIWTIDSFFDVSKFFHGGHIENGWFDPFLRRNATGKMSHLKEQKKCYRISIVSGDRGGGAYRATIHPWLISFEENMSNTIVTYVPVVGPAHLLLPGSVLIHTEPAVSCLHADLYLWKNHSVRFSQHRIHHHESRREHVFMQ